MDRRPSVQMEINRMRDDQELSIDQLSGVVGGMTNNNNGSLPYPKPSPVEVLIRWILSKF